MLKFIEYPKCSTCIKARKYLNQLGLEYTKRHIVDEKLNKEELLALYKKSGLPLKRFFNTSGLKYRELNLKDKLPTMSEDEQLTLLASDGMLVKRPIIETDDRVLVGFKANEYDSLK
ncbi:arsenate reductase family protein [Thomasclavelia spiroformis]|uniref:arsenate reductase family protein n=1 Tax=Thomasclavelia spiroformis TaxID=29348 RepID=UPI002420137C|nr:arsenate reductase family protein [Thomasclavelia spiroformis]MBS6685618.1 arsenate reductase family protein [Thomasclavelia spiroformis]